MESIIVDFNEHVILFTKRILSLIPYSGMIDKDYIINKIKNMSNGDTLLRKFIYNVLEFKPYIDKKNDAFFLTTTFQDKVENNGELKQLGFLKRIWGDLTKKQQNIIFLDLQYLYYFTSK